MSVETLSKVETFTKVTYMPVVNLANGKKYESFKEALNDFIAQVRTSVQQGTSWQILETGCWIAREKLGTTMPLCFYNARDFGIKMGLLDKNSFPIADAPEPDPALVANLFGMAVLTGGDADYFIKSLVVTGHGTARFEPKDS